MKFYLIGLLMAVIMTGTVNAQHMNVGIKGGLNLYNIHNTNLHTKANIHAGLLGHFHLTDKIAFQPEVMYSAQGGKYNNSNVENTGNRINLNYINVPVLFQYMFNNGFRIEAGPQAGFLVSANSKTSETTTDIKNNYKTLDLGIGAGVSYVFTDTGFGLDARYNHGLRNINENTAVKSTNRGFQGGIFYLFNHH